MHVLAFQMHELLKTRPALSADISILSAISAMDHPLLIAIPLGSVGDMVMVTGSAPAGCTEALLSL